MELNTNLDNDLFSDLEQIIEQGKNEVARQVNSTIAFVYWQVGKKISEHILNNQRAEYGKQIVPTLSAQLEKQYGRSFNEKNVRRMMQFAEAFPEIEIVVTASRKLSWSHLFKMNFQNKSGLKGQHISAQGNALGTVEKSKTVRDGKMKKAKIFFRTELRNRSINNYKLFRRQPQFFIEKCHRPNDIKFLHSTQGVALC